MRRDCPKLKNRGNGNGNGTTQGRAYALGGRDASPDSNVITSTYLLNNSYAKILFDTGADRSFVSSTFSASISITPTTLENHYDVELADGKIIGVNTVIRGCTLNFMNHLFNIDLMPVPLGSFDVIIGMDWLTKYHGVIICDENIIRVPFKKETLIFQGDGSKRVNLCNGDEAIPLDIILSCSKAQKILSKRGIVASVARGSLIDCVSPSELKELAESKLVARELCDKDMSLHVPQEGSKECFGNRSSSGCHDGLWWLIEDEEDDEVVICIWREFIRRDLVENGMSLNWFRNFQNLF
ncbi:putative reverse transcriptase domain-containing protein [Tanacetum coccineum]